MNSGFYSHTATPHEIRRCKMNFMRNYSRKHTNNLDGAFESKKNDYDDEMGKYRCHQEEKVSNQAENEGKKTYTSNSKPSKLYTQQNIREKIDRILLKNALSHIETSDLHTNMNTSIQQDAFFTHLPEKNQRQNPNTPQNEQMNIQNGLKQRKVKPRLQISETRANIIKNSTMTIIDSYRNRQFAKVNFEQYKQKSLLATPSQNQWQNFMNLIRSEKKQSEKNKKYCRIMIRRINTDQLFTKRAQSHKKIPTDKGRHLKHLKRMKPIKNIMSEATPLKKPKDMPLYDKSMNSDTQDIELNPWSTTEIKLKEQYGPLHHL